MQTIEAPTKNSNRVVTQAEWIEARKALLEKEKAHVRVSDELARERRELPWVKVEKEYLFDTPAGKRTLAELFDGRSQLVVYHFMLAPGWEHGCVSCSYLADHFDGMIPHLNHREVTFTAISRAPFEQIAAFKARMGWKFPWASSNANTFNADYNVSFTPEQMAGSAVYNFNEGPVPLPELPGISVFYKDEAGTVFRTYSAYARGVEPLVGTYQVLDLVPKGRDEEGLAFDMAWVRHHDRYDANYKLDTKSGYPLPRTVEGGACGCCCGTKG